MGFWGKNKNASQVDSDEFTTEENVDNLLWIDYTHELFMIKTKQGMKPKYLAKFKDLESYSVFENGKELVKRSGVGRALVGGALFGGTGAVVGAMTGKEKDVSYVNMLMVEIEMRSGSKKKNVQRIPLIIGKTKTTSLSYQKAQESVDNILTALDNIVKYKSEHNK